MNLFHGAWNGGRKDGHGLSELHGTSMASVPGSMDLFSIV